MKSSIILIVIAVIFGAVTCDGGLAPPSCVLQEENCRKNCADGGGEEAPCKTTCGMDQEACKCLQEKECSTTECTDGCYESIKDDYDCDVSEQACHGFCKNQYDGDENCINGYCKINKEKCECLKAGNCPETNLTTEPVPMPSCKFLHGRCQKNCRDGEGEDSDCDALCQADSEICACTRKNKCGSSTPDTGDVQKCFRRCQSAQKDKYNCDTFYKTCLGNCKNNFAGETNCPQFCSKSLEDCKCIILGECKPTP